MQANNSPAAFTLPSTVTLENASSSTSRRQVMTMQEKRNTIPHWAALGLWGLWQWIRGSSGRQRSAAGILAQRQHLPKLSPVIVNCCYIVNLDDTFTQAQCPIQLVTLRGAKRI